MFKLEWHRNGSVVKTFRCGATLEMASTVQQMCDPSRASIWLADFDDELDLDDYLSTQFEGDFGFHPQADGVPDGEYDFGTLRPLAELLEGFHLAKKYAPAAIALAGDNGIVEAHAAYVLTWFNYDSTLESAARPDEVKRMRFLGAVTLG